MALHHPRLPTLIALPIAAALAVGCGSDGGDTGDGTGSAPVDMGPPPNDMDADEWTDEIDNCPMIANPEQRDRDGDGIGDVCDPCPASPNEADECQPIDEVEPNDQVEQAQMIDLVPAGQFREVRGSIEDPTVDDQALDTFAFEVEARTVLRFRVSRADAGSRLQPGFIVRGPEGFSPRRAGDLFVVEREVYFPQAGTYTVSVGDQRGLFGSNAFGEQEATYALAIERTEAEVREVTVGFTDREIGLSDPTEILILESEIVGERFTFLQLSAVVGETNDEFLDTILIAEFGEEDPTIFESDNVGEGVTDSRLVVEDPAPGKIRLVLENADIVGPRDVPYSVLLTFEEFDNLPELEPNDAPDLAASLRYPAMAGANDLTEGVISRTDPADIDWFSFQGTAADITRFTVQAQNNLQPFVALFQQVGAEADDVELLFQTDAAQSAQIEAILSATGTYYLAITDRRNLTDEGPVGGQLFDYQVLAENRRSFNPRGTFSSSGQGGATVNENGRLETNVLIPAQPSIVDVTLGGAGTISPVLTLYGPDGDGIISRTTARRVVAFLPDTGLAHPITLHDADAYAGGYTYTIGVNFEPVTPTTEVEPNNSVTMGAQLALPTFPRVVTGEIAPDNPDWFSFTPDSATPFAVFANGDAGNISIAITDEMGIVEAPGTGGFINVFTPTPGTTYGLQVVSSDSGSYQLVFTDN